MTWLGAFCNCLVLSRLFCFKSAFVSFLSTSGVLSLAGRHHGARSVSSLRSGQGERYVMGAEGLPGDFLRSRVVVGPARAVHPLWVFVLWEQIKGREGAAALLGCPLQSKCPQEAGLACRGLKFLEVPRRPCALDEPCSTYSCRNTKAVVWCFAPGPALTPVAQDLPRWWHQLQGQRDFTLRLFYTVLFFLSSSSLLCCWYWKHVLCVSPLVWISNLKAAFLNALILFVSN